MINLPLILAAATLQAPQAAYPVRWTRAVGPPSRQELKAQLKRPVKLPRGQKIYEHTARGSEIRTCVDYTRAKKDGWRDNANGYERATEGFFKDQCDATMLILAAKPSRVSYVKNFRLDETVLDSLPPSLSFTPFGEHERAANAAERQGLSWKKFKPGLKLLKKGANWITVEEPGESRIDLEIKSFGDFNEDGIEDILVFKSDSAIGGTFNAHYPIILTRLTARGPVKAFDVEESDIEKAGAKVLPTGLNKQTKVPR